MGGGVPSPRVGQGGELQEMEGMIIGRKNMG